jgi:membrane protein DedA with SNARE-associated domain
MNMMHWLHSLLPHIPRYGYVIVFIVAFLNNIGLPLPGETILLGAGFVFGRVTTSLWEPMAAGALACFLGGICAFWFGRRLGHSGLKKIRWLHLTPERTKWPDEFFKRHGDKVVLIAKFVPLFPPVVVNLLAGTSKMKWRNFLIYNCIGSTAYSIWYILIGYFFGKKWKDFETWLGPAPLYLIVGGLLALAAGVFFRSFLAKTWARLHSRRRNPK